MTSDLTADLRRWARQQPDAPAVEFKDRSLTYQELDEQSSALAAALHNLGVRPGDRIGMWLRKSIESIVVIYGALKAGAIYVPIDPSAPARRMSRILADCAVTCVVTNDDQCATLATHTDTFARSCPVITVGDAVDATPATAHRWDKLLASGTTPDYQFPAREPDDPAYILYTSGSKGSPKGVTISHRNARAFVDWAVDEFRMVPHDRVASHAPLHFDLSVLDVYATCRAGGCVVLIPESQIGFGAALNSFVADRRITVWYSVPNALGRMLTARNHGLLAGSSLRIVLFAGETMPVGHLRRLREVVAGADLYNLYGPTETNVCVFHRIRDEDVAQERTEPAPIGRPCPYAPVYVVAQDGRPLDPRPGQYGELLVAGDSVMLGYWQDEELTASRTAEVVLPDGGRATAYRTGDMVRMDDSLNYVFCGREDDMIKIRGYRVEIGEVESAISTADHVREVVCIPFGETSAVERIDAYVVATDESRLDIAALRRHCLERLPRYMVPERVHVVAELPRTSSGKINRRALLDT